MSRFHHSRHLSEIIEASHREPVVIYKHSVECGTSTRTLAQLEEALKEKIILAPIYIVVVQDQKNLSQNISEWFEVKHESPQVLLVSKGKSIYNADHDDIDPLKLKFT